MKKKSKIKIYWYIYKQISLSKFGKQQVKIKGAQVVNYSLKISA